MARPARDELPFDEDDLEPVLARMRQMRTAGAGWVNLLPEVEPEAPVPRSGGLFSALFTARGPAIPMGTWAPARADRPGPMSVGIEHAAGPRALAMLAEHQLGLPTGWRKLADHPKRGLVVAAPADADLDQLLWWLLASCHVLAKVPLTGSWLAQVYG